ncbi:MAG: hypothetical protein JWP89_2743 [Schlesneria sp.]|nr:hypothetical protein [Schlesneria sp.]
MPWLNYLRAKNQRSDSKWQRFASSLQFRPRCMAFIRGSRAILVSLGTPFPSCSNFGSLSSMSSAPDISDEYILYLWDLRQELPVPIARLSNLTLEELDSLQEYLQEKVNNHFLLVTRPDVQGIAGLRYATEVDTQIFRVTRSESITNWLDVATRWETCVKWREGDDFSEVQDCNWSLWGRVLQMYVPSAVTELLRMRTHKTTSPAQLDTEIVTPGPPTELLHELSNQQRKVLLHLWTKVHATSWWSLPDECWRSGATTGQEKRTIESALERLRDALNAKPKFGLTLEVHSAAETTKLVGKPARK